MKVTELPPAPAAPAAVKDGKPAPAAKTPRQADELSPEALAGVVGGGKVYTR